VRFVKIAILLGAPLAALMATAGAWAASLAPAYDSAGPNIEQQVSGQENAANTLGQLPFTGVDLALIVAAGLLLVLAGFSMRRVGTARSKTKA
jgi:hypothetical protein